jgi:hypothetical protein
MYRLFNLSARYSSKAWGWAIKHICEWIFDGRITHAEFDLNRLKERDEVFFRLDLIDKDGRTACTNPYYFKLRSTALINRSDDGHWPAVYAAAIARYVVEQPHRACRRTAYACRVAGGGSSAGPANHPSIRTLYGQQDMERATASGWELFAQFQAVYRRDAADYSKETA